MLFRLNFKRNSSVWRSVSPCISTTVWHGLCHTKRYIADIILVIEVFGQDYFLFNIRMLLGWSVICQVELLMFNIRFIIYLKKYNVIWLNTWICRIAPATRYAFRRFLSNRTIVHWQFVNLLCYNQSGHSSIRRYNMDH